MTKRRTWWIVKEAAGDLYIYVKGPANTSVPEPLKFKQAPHRKFSAVAGSAVYEKRKGMVKILFKGNDDPPNAFYLDGFQWNATDVSSELRPFVKDVKRFSQKFNEVVGATAQVVTEADVHRAFDFDSSESDMPDIGSSPPQIHSTPARVSFQSQRQAPASPTEEVPMLYKKRKEAEISPDDRIMEEVKKNFLGYAKIPTGHLKLGIQLREVRETFVQELMSHMTEFHGHFYQPLCVIVDTLDDVTHFRECNASGYHYTVIGGCHNFTAAQRLSEMYPGQEIFKSRYCSIYSNNLSEEARLWLAHRHNKIGEFRHSMTLTDKILFKGNDDPPNAFYLDGFQWNATDVSSELRPFVKDVKRFSQKFNEVVGATAQVVTEADVHRAFDFDSSESDMPDIGSSPPQIHSTPARVSFQSQRQAPASPTEEVPMLYKKRKEAEISPDDRIMEEVKKNFLGYAKIPTGHLKLGIQLREVRETFVQELMSHMTEFHGHFYQPLCVIVDTLDDVTHFRECNASGYHYTVIGGCHNFTAAQRLSEMYPGQEIFKSRYCSIYSNNLSEEARLWLAHRHNKIGEFRHSMTLTDKIQLCRNIYISQTEIGNDDWQATLRAILSPGESKAVCKLVIKLATLDEEVFGLLQEVLKLHSNGKLKCQKLSTSEIVNGPDMKPYVLSTLPALPTHAIKHLLTEVKECRMTISQIQKEAKLLNKLHTVQRMFMDLLGLRTWNDAREKYPHATQRQVLEHFCQFNLRSTPGELKVFCSQLMRERDTVSSATFRGHNGALAYPVLCDAGFLDGEQISREVSSFCGAALVILDMPQDWTCTDVKKFVNTITSININHQMDDFTIAVMSTLQNMAVAEMAIKESRHFAEPMSLIYMVPKEDTSDDTKLTNCVEGVTIASKTHSRRIRWKAGHHRNYLEVKADPSFCIDGYPVDPEQKPVEIYQELVATFTSPREWVMDACSGTGSACIAAVKEGRNAVALEKDEGMMRSLRLRLSTEVKEYVEEDVEEVCAEEERNVEEEDGTDCTDDEEEEGDDAEEGDS